MTQTGSNELGEATAISVAFSTQNPIPVGAQLTISLSNNFVFEDTFEVKLNGVAVTATVNKIAFSLTMNYVTSVRRMLQDAPMQEFVLEITKGLKNPSIGPYRYNYFNIQFSTADGAYGIDGSLDKTKWINQDCIGDCKVCETTLDYCTSCGLDRETGLISFYFLENKCM